MIFSPHKKSTELKTHILKASEDIISKDDSVIRKSTENISLIMCTSTQAITYNDMYVKAFHFN